MKKSLVVVLALVFLFSTTYSVMAKSCTDANSPKAACPKDKANCPKAKGECPMNKAACDKKDAKAACDKDKKCCDKGKKKGHEKKAEDANSAGKKA